MELATTSEKFFEALKTGNTAEVNSLLKSGTIGVDEINTALVIAAKEGHGLLVDSLIDHGAAVDGNIPVSLYITLCGHIILQLGVYKQIIFDCNLHRTLAEYTGKVIRKRNC